MPIQHDKSEQRMVAKWLRENGLQVGALIAVMSGGFARMETISNEHTKRIDAMALEIRHHHECGGTGMVDPATHGSLDLHLEHWHQEHFGRAGWRKLTEQFSTNGVR